MIYKKYIEEVINEKTGFHKFYAWDRNVLKEIIKNKLENDDEEFLESIATDIDNGEEVSIETYDISKFRIATEEEKKLALQYEKERASEIEAMNMDASKVFEKLERIYKSQFEN